MGALREAFSIGHGRLSEQLATTAAALESQDEHVVLIAILHNVRAHLSDADVTVNSASCRPSSARFASFE
jgi:hypothetical protein